MRISSGQKSGHSPDQENRMSFAMAITIDFKVCPFNSLSGNFGRQMCCADCLALSCDSLCSSVLELP